MTTKIYTKTGDLGQTGLFGGKRLPKDDVRIEAYGTVDELNAHIGHLSDNLEDEHSVNFLKSLQNQLFNLGSSLAVDPSKDLKVPSVNEAHCRALEEEIDRMDAKLPELKQFILPSGHPVSSLAHLARTVCRRAERRLVSLAHKEEVDPVSVKYLNRLSDYLFVLARYILILKGSKEVHWVSGA